MMDDQIHWFSIINSLMIVLFLSGMVAMIMMRTLHRDISKYNQLETAEEAQEETGWKLVCPLHMHCRSLMRVLACTQAGLRVYVCCYLRCHPGAVLSVKTCNLVWSCTQQMVQHCRASKC